MHYENRKNDTENVRRSGKNKSKNVKEDWEIF